MKNVVIWLGAAILLGASLEAGAQCCTRRCVDTCPDLTVAQRCALGPDYDFGRRTSQRCPMIVSINFQETDIPGYDPTGQAGCVDAIAGCVGGGVVDGEFRGCVRVGVAPGTPVSDATAGMEYGTHPVPYECKTAAIDGCEAAGSVVAVPSDPDCPACPGYPGDAACAAL